MLGGGGGALRGSLRDGEGSLLPHACEECGGEVAWGGRLRFFDARSPVPPFPVRCCSCWATSAS